MLDGAAAAARGVAQHEDVRLGRRGGGGEPRLGEPRLQERARRGGHGGGARAEEGRGLVRVGRAQRSLEDIIGLQQFIAERARTSARAWVCVWEREREREREREWCAMMGRNLNR